MAKSMRLSLARLKEVLRRQDLPQWGRNYDPAIRATREEAPARSRFAQVWSERLGRYCHVLSSVEQDALLLALFHPGLFELQEQRILVTEARPHPLCGHVLAAGMSLPPLRGTIDVCDRLDMIGRHPWLNVDHPDGSGRIQVPTPFIGDFLLFLMDQDGPYCVNWTIKSSPDEFQHRLLGTKPARNPQAEISAVRSRHAIEERYYADAGIPTIRIVEHDLPELLIQNLRNLLLVQHRAVEVDAGLYAEICDRLQASIQTGQVPLDVLLSVMHRHDLSFDLAKASFARALWKRDVRAELMDEVIFIDRPLRTPRQDPLQVFSAWFARPPV
ncbi:hypothetical protein [Chromobacterium subtsugae]|uniref:hypothetical protein n=1 Tax=Chromobacterium subtsugae TaxID=251747 RepID=UPI000ADAC249|nr:hypothetical protein [Chromobacterium subtsugae]